METSGPTRIRTRAALAKTAVHLRKIMNSESHTPTVIYNFLFDRMRAVRQDLYTQGIVVRRALHRAVQPKHSAGVVSLAIVHSRLLLCGRLPMKLILYAASGRPSDSLLVLLSSSLPTFY